MSKKWAVTEIAEVIKMLDVEIKRAKDDKGLRVGCTIMKQRLMAAKNYLANS